MRSTSGPEQQMHMMWKIVLLIYRGVCFQNVWRSMFSSAAGFFFFLHASPYIPIYILPTPRALEEEKYIVVVYLHKRKTLAYSAPLSLRERL